MMHAPADLAGGVQLRAGGYEVDLLVTGYPGKTVCHGGLGWSTIVLLRGHGRVALIDTGGIGVRRHMIAMLARYGLKPMDVTDVLLTHAHYDHMMNWTTVQQARIVIGAHELDWASKEPWAQTVVPELYVRELQTWPTLQTAVEGDEVMPGITARLAPGHTPGHLIYVLRGEDRDIVFTGDAAKNRAELVCGRTDMTYDEAVSSASVAAIWTLWRSRAGNVVVPGHDIPMVLKDGRPDYLARREAGINAWFGDDIDTMTALPLTK
jgi:N-acyl homoserine lactone hydrolase